MSYASQDKIDITRVSNETRYLDIQRIERIRENSLYQKHKTDEEFIQMEEDIRAREITGLKDRGLI